MKIENLKDLGRLIALCRKTGVESIRVDGIELHLGKEPQKPMKMTAAKASTVPRAPDAAPTIDEILSEGLTDEQLLYYSVSAQPDSSAATPEQN